MSRGCRLKYVGHEREKAAGLAVIRASRYNARMSIPTAPLASALLLSLLILMLAAMPGCGAPETSDAKISTIEVTMLDDMQARGAVMVDVRSAQAFATGHIPGAVNVPLPTIDEALKTRLVPGRPLVVYADGGLGVATAASKKLIHLGYPNVHEFRGGLSAWKAANRPTE